MKYNSITKKWGGVKLQKEFDGKIDDWIKQFENVEKGILIDILKHYNYYTVRKVTTGIEVLFKKFIELYKEDPREMVFIPVYKDYGVGFSDDFFNNFWIKNNLKESAEKNIYELLKAGSVFEKIVIVDDYSGSGKTIENTIKHCIEVNENIKKSIFYILTIQMSTKAKERLEKFAVSQEMNIKVCSIEIVEKVFNNTNMFEKSIAEKKRNEYIDICTKHGISRRYQLGHEKTQALLSFYYNTPNNTLGLFWEENDNYSSIFKRHKPVETKLSAIQKDTKERKNEQKSGIIKKHEVDERYNYLMVYLLNEDNELDYNKARSKFGMTEEQMDEAIIYLIKNDFIIISSGRIKATDKLKECIKISKIRELKDMKSNEDKPNNIQENASYLPRNFEKEFRGYK